MAEKDLTRGVIAGIAGGLVAAFVVNAFVRGPGKRIALALGKGDALPAPQTKDELLMHYGFGAAIGAVYGGLAEYVPAVTTGRGGTLGSLLLSGADMLNVPGADVPSTGLPGPLAAHVMFGMTAETVRRVVREAI